MVMFETLQKPPSTVTRTSVARLFCIQSLYVYSADFTNHLQHITHRLKESVRIVGGTLKCLDIVGIFCIHSDYMTPVNRCGEYVFFNKSTTSLIQRRHKVNTISTCYCRKQRSLHKVVYTYLTNLFRSPKLHHLNCVVHFEWNFLILVFTANLI